MFDERVSKIITDLATVQENLKTFPIEIWKELEPEDITSIEEYTNLMKEINRLISDLDGISQSLIHATQQLSESPDVTEKNMEATTDDGKLLSIPSGEKVHYVDEIFTGKTPYAIILEDKPYLVKAWTDVYVTICRHFLTVDRDRMLEYISSRGINHFAVNSWRFGPRGTHLEKNLYVKTNLSAVEICNRIKLIFGFLGFQHSSLKIFLIGDSDTVSKLQVSSRSPVNSDLLA